MAFVIFSFCLSCLFFLSRFLAILDRYLDKPESAAPPKRSSLHLKQDTSQLLSSDQRVMSTATVEKVKTPNAILLSQRDGPSVPEQQIMSKKAADRHLASTILQEEYSRPNLSKTKNVPKAKPTSTPKPKPLFLRSNTNPTVDEYLDFYNDLIADYAPAYPDAWIWERRRLARFSHRGNQLHFLLFRQAHEFALKREARAKRHCSIQWDLVRDEVEESISRGREDYEKSNNNGNMWVGTDLKAMQASVMIDEDNAVE